MKKIFSLIIVFLVLLLAFSVYKMRGQSSLEIGDKVPSFSLMNQLGEPFNIDDHIGKKAMVIYFYPKDDTPGCTKEACSFRDSYEKFTDKNIPNIEIVIPITVTNNIIFLPTFII